MPWPTFQSIDEISFDFTPHGVDERRELSREILSRGRWTTIAFLFQDKINDKLRLPQVAITRWKSTKRGYELFSKFTVTGRSQAARVLTVIDLWFRPGGLADAVQPSSSSSEGCPPTANSARAPIGEPPPTPGDEAPSR